MSSRLPPGRPTFASLDSGPDGASPGASPRLTEGPSGLPDLPRVLGRLGPPDGGPVLVAVGGIHGNEPAGVLALQRVVARLGADASHLQGHLLALTGNRKALAADRRYLLDDLNRAWRADRLQRVRADSGPLHAEDEELRDLDAVLQPALAAARGRVAVLDLHSTSGQGGVFTTLDDTLANRALAQRLPVPQVLGLEEELSGTMLGHLVDQGVTAVGFESGQHRDPLSVDRAEAAVWITLDTCGVLAPGLRAEVAAARAFLERDEGRRPGFVEVRYRHHITPETGFVMRPGYRSFQPLREGEVLANDRQGPVASPLDGFMLMPLYQPQGADGFFVVQPVRPAWLALSAHMRRWRLDRWVHLLPGVRRDEEPGVLVVDLRRARWLAREVFHLLGYKRIALDGTTLRLRKRSDGGPP